MNSERLKAPYKNGEILNQEQITRLVLSQETLSALSLLTMSYGYPMDEKSNAIKLHHKLIELADSGTAVSLGVDNTYAHRLTPKDDLPAFMANLVGQGELIKRRERALKELGSHPNINVRFNGAEHASFFPLRRLDHRKLLLLSQDIEPDFSIIFGFNLNHQMDNGIIDSGIFIKDPDALEWLQLQEKSPHISPPAQETTDSFTFTTREVGEGGNTLADEQILDVINSAQDNLIFCTQFIPDGEIFDDLMSASDRGVDVSIYTNFPPASRQPIYSLLRYVLARRLSSQAHKRGNLHFYVPSDKKNYFHMKALVADGNDSARSQALTGTDSMSGALLHNLGTREIMVRLDKASHREDLVNYIQSNVHSNAVPLNGDNLNFKRYFFNQVSSR
jgi:phosphatidylserine/phosphatidylglycerophosphate/cardiolipin synthase-like enzyme